MPSTERNEEIARNILDSFGFSDGLNIYQRDALVKEYSEALHAKDREKAEAVARLEEQARRVEQLQVQLAGCSAEALGYGKDCTVTDYGWSASFGDVRRLREKFEAQSSLMEKMSEFTKHDKDCLCAQLRQGRPTNDGGYETLYGYGEEERCYQRDEQPKCSCGLRDVLTAYELSKEGKV